ncbi:cytochrome P450 [Cladochytrium replicatum]|nr:cytochrome P450 [Cladochytrium replicatum]
MALSAIVLVITGAAIVISYVLWSSRDTNARALASIPAAPGELPIIGHLLPLSSAKSGIDLMNKWAWQYGPVTRMTLFGKTTLLISGPEYITALMRKTESVFGPSRSFGDALASVGLGKALGAHDGSVHERRVMRKLLEKPFSATQVGEMRKSIVSVGLQLREDFREGIARAEVEERSDPMAFEKSQMNFLRMLKKTTFHALMVLAYDMQYEEYSDLINLDDLELISAKLNERILIPFRYYHYFKTKSDREVDQCVNRITASAHTIIQQAMEKPERAETMLLKGFLANQNDENGEKIDYDILIGNVIGNLLAGYDTTANTLFLLMHWLAKEPEVQQKVQKEVDGILKTLGSIEDVANLDPKENFKYVHAVIRETNRLTPIATGTIYTASNDVQIDGLFVPKGVEVLLCNNVATLKQSSFEDRFAFRPERWYELDSNEELRTKELASFMPFSGGPHICPGRHLAIAEMIYFVVILCSEFEVSYKSVPTFVQNLLDKSKDRPLQIKKRAAL